MLWVMICTMMEDAKGVVYISTGQLSTLSARVICSLGGPDQYSILVCPCRFSPATKATESPPSFARPDAG